MLLGMNVSENSLDKVIALVFEDMLTFFSESPQDLTDRMKATF
jgi:hypothetical protein